MHDCIAALTSSYSKNSVLIRCPRTWRYKPPLSKISSLEKVFENLRFRWPKMPLTCGRNPPFSKLNIPIRVCRASILNAHMLFSLTHAHLHFLFFASIVELTLLLSLASLMRAMDLFCFRTKHNVRKFNAKSDEKGIPTWKLMIAANPYGRGLHNSPQSSPTKSKLNLLRNTVKIEVTINPQVQGMASKKHLTIGVSLVWYFKR